MAEAQSRAAFTPIPQNAPGATAAVGHTLENGIPLSIFPISVDKLCICFCGLPGRGKTHISRRLAQYLTFFHAVPVEVYNLAEYRRTMFGTFRDASAFDPSNGEGKRMLEACRESALEAMRSFLQNTPNGIAILDHNNATHLIRKSFMDSAHACGAKVLFIEVSNDDDIFLQKQHLQTAHCAPDYQGLDEAAATEFYNKKVDIYRRIYEPIGNPEEAHWSYITCNHSKQHFVVHNMKGYLQQKIVNFIMNLRTTSHSFFLSRHGQSEYNDMGRIGGDSGLTEDGRRYAMALAEYVETRITKDKDGNEVPARLWTSTMRRTKETAQFIQQKTLRLSSNFDANIQYEWIQMRPRAWHHLDELFAGSCDGMTYEEIEAKFPDEWQRRSVDKLAYRYPRGESYLDVIARLEPIIIEMERHEEPLLIVAHQGILRIIYAFYMGCSRADAPYLSIPLNTVVELTPGAFTCNEARHVLYRTETRRDGQDERRPGHSAPPPPPQVVEAATAAGAVTHNRQDDDPPSH